MKIPKINRFSLFGLYLVMSIYSLIAPRSTRFLLDAYKRDHIRRREDKAHKDL
jgi:hypothetical protein